MSWGEQDDGDVAYASWAQQIEHAVGDGNPAQGNSYVVFYHTGDSEYKARNGLDGTIDYHDSNADVVINNCIRAVSNYGTIRV